MKKLNVNGTLSGGLKIYADSELLFYSKLKSSWFDGCLISIFDSSDELILTVKEKRVFGSKFKIQYQNKSWLNEKFKLINRLPAISDLIIADGNTYSLVRSWIAVINPNSKILLNGKEIGGIKMKRLSLERDYELEIYESNEKAEFYSLILFLCTESNSDFE